MSSRSKRPGGYGVCGMSQSCQHSVKFRLTQNENGYRLRLTESRFRYLTEWMTISVVLIRKRMRRFLFLASPQTLSRPSAQAPPDLQDRPSVTILKSLHCHSL